MVAAALAPGSLLRVELDELPRVDEPKVDEPTVDELPSVEELPIVDELPSVDEPFKADELFAAGPPIAVVPVEGEVFVVLPGDVGPASALDVELPGVVVDAMLLLPGVEMEEDAVPLPQGAASGTPVVCAIAATAQAASAAIANRFIKSLREVRFPDWTRVRPARSSQSVCRCAHTYATDLPGFPRCGRPRVALRVEAMQQLGFARACQRDIGQLHVAEAAHR